MKKERVNISQHIVENKFHINLSTPELVEKVLQRQEGVLTTTGAVSTTTGKYTGRSPKDRFIVCDDVSEHTVDWGSVNQPIDEVSFEKLLEKVTTHLNKQEALYRFKGYAGADPTYELAIDVINEYAWHNLFASQLFISPSATKLQTHESDFTILCAPTCYADPTLHGTNSETFIIMSLKKRCVLIGGTEYAGEMKKSVFSMMNYLLPEQNVLPMHCSANASDADDVALFFGLSGTGKTTLSADATRKLIGDDEHGWGPNGVFNMEGGCYAKCDHLSEQSEPEIYHAIQFGSVLENVIIDEQTREPIYTDTSLTENTRVSYPITNMENIKSPSIGGHPTSIIFLTADASGTLPPISKLSESQAMYHFLSGYTSRLAGTERGVTEPEATFSACFGAPFLPRDPVIYAEMLGEKMKEHHVNVFLVNTGWTGGPYGVGKRIDLKHTRAMVAAAIKGKLDNVKTEQESHFGLHIPQNVPNVPNELLFPKNTWDDKDAYEQAATNLVQQFQQNFKQFNHVDKAIKRAGPSIQK